MEPFKSTYRIDKTVSPAGFVEILEEAGFVISGSKRPLVFYDGSRRIYQIYEEDDSHERDVCGHLETGGLLNVFNRNGNRLVEFMSDYEAPEHVPEEQPGEGGRGWPFVDA